MLTPANIEKEYLSESLDQYRDCLKAHLIKRMHQPPTAYIESVLGKAKGTAILTWETIDSKTE